MLIYVLTELNDQETCALLLHLQGFCFAAVARVRLTCQLRALLPLLPWLTLLGTDMWLQSFSFLSLLRNVCHRGRGMLCVRNVVIYANWAVVIGVTSWPQPFMSFTFSTMIKVFFFCSKYQRLHINSSLEFTNYIISTRMCQGQLSEYQTLMRALPTILSHF